MTSTTNALNLSRANSFNSANDGTTDTRQRPTYDVPATSQTGLRPMKGNKDKPPPRTTLSASQSGTSLAGGATNGMKADSTIDVCTGTTAPSVDPVSPTFAAVSSESRTAASSSVTQAVGQFIYHHCDIVSALSRMDDDKFVEGLKELRDGSEASLLGNLRNHVAGVTQTLAESGLPPDMIKECRKLADDIEKELAVFETEARSPGRWLKAATSFLALSALPAAMPFISGQTTYAPILFSFYIKTAVLAAGLARRATTDDRTWVRHIAERHVNNLLLAAAFVGPTFAKSASFLNDSIPYNVGMSAASLAVALGSMYPDKFKALVKRAETAHIPELQQELRDQMRMWFEQIGADADLLSLERRRFEDSGRRMSDSTSEKVGAVLDKYDLLGAQLGQLLGIAAQDGGDGVTGEAGQAEEAKHDPARMQKLVIAIAATGICLGGAAFMVPNNLNGLSDLLADAAFVGIVSFVTALNPNASLQDMITKFKSFTGGSTVSYGLLVPDKITGFLAESMPGLIIGTAGMTAANLILPGLVSEGLASLIGRLSTGSKEPGAADVTELQEVHVHQGENENAQSPLKAAE